MKPIAISCGEPAGIGPEVAAKAWLALKDDVPMVWVGDPNHLPDDFPIQKINAISEAKFSGSLPVIVKDFGANALPSLPNPDHAQYVIETIETCVHLAKQGDVSAICTAPIHKAALKDGAGFPFPGHTEFLAHLADNAEVVMMLACDELRVVPATIHIALKDVPKTLTASRLTDTILITQNALRRDFGIENPRIAVAGLNPHAGEDGKMGIEEIDMITPVLEALRAQGLNLIGPMSADTMFHRQARERYDVAVCMYHDQALIPIKTIDFAGGVNVTLGLPFIRTSPDHGTAFDIAGKNIADPTSMIAAIKMAAKMAANR